MTTTLRSVPQLPRPADFIGKDGKFSIVGYSYLNELEKTVEDIRTLSETLSTAATDAASELARIEGLIPVVSQSALIQRTNTVYYGVLSALQSAGDVVGIGDIEIYPSALDNYIWLFGSVTHSRASSGADADGFTVRVRLRNAATEILVQDWTEPTVLCTPFAIRKTAFEWMILSGIAPEVGNSIDFTLQATDATVSFRINENSFFYAEEVAA